jgi:MtaA/CmuA family methyltransferase
MTGRERVLAMIDGRATDSLPLMPITMMFAGDASGILYRDYATDARALADAQLRVAERFDFDYVSAISDPAREAADLGAVIEWFDNQPPAIVEERALLADKSVLASLRVPEPSSGARMSDRVRAVQLLAEGAGGERIVEGWVEGPCAMAADLRGLNRLMFDFVDDPDFVRELFAFTVEMELAFASAQVSAGAELIGIGDAAASLVGPRLYETFVLPFEQKLIAGIKTTGARTRLHICGNTRRILAGMGTTRADIIDLDFPAPMPEGRAAMGPAQVLLGNVHPVRVLRDGSVEEVYAAFAQCYEAAGPKYIVGAGCEIPRGTPTENVEAMTRFARTHQTQPRRASGT